jgi:hypothetical protein
MYGKICKNSNMITAFISTLLIILALLALRPRLLSKQQQ